MTRAVLLSLVAGPCASSQRASDFDVPASSDASPDHATPGTASVAWNRASSGLARSPVHRRGCGEALVGLGTTSDGVVGLAPFCAPRLSEYTP